MKGSFLHVWMPSVPCSLSLSSVGSHPPEPLHHSTMASQNKISYVEFSFLWNEFSEDLEGNCKAFSDLTLNYAVVTSSLFHGSKHESYMPTIFKGKRNSEEHEPTAMFAEDGEVPWETRDHICILYLAVDMYL